MASDFEKGEILEAEKRDWKAGYHPIIFWEKYDEDFFVGLMMSKSKKHGNILLNDNHFVTRPDETIVSLFAPRALLKKWEWGGFTKVGMLSEEGINWVEASLPSDPPILWEELMKSIGKS